MSKLMSLTAAVANRTALTVPQLEGWACVICAVLGIPAVFVGMIGGREVYACNACADNTPPTTRPAPASTCPAWCADEHAHPVDIEHISENLTLAAPDSAETTGPDGIVRQVEVVAELRQNPGELLRVSLGVCEGVECLTDTEMSLDEAEQLMTRLQTLIAAARQGVRSS